MIEITLSTLTKTIAFTLPLSALLIIVLAFVLFRLDLNAPPKAGATSKSGGRVNNRPTGGQSNSRPVGRVGGGRRLEGLGGGIGSASQGLGRGIGSASQGLGRGIGETAKGLGDGLGKAVGGAGTFVKGLGGLVKGFGAIVKGTGEGLGGVGRGLGALATGLSKPMSTVGKGVANASRAVRDEVVGDLAWGWDAYQARAKDLWPQQPQQQPQQPQQPQQLPRNVLDAGSADEAEKIRDICKACGVEADVDGTHVAINPHKLEHAEKVLRMADYDVNFANDEDEEIILDYDPETDTWDLAGQKSKTWGEWANEMLLKAQLAWDPRPDGKFPEKEEVGT